MADTKGLMETRSEWMEAYQSGETELPHKQWYEAKYGSSTPETQNLADVLAKKEKSPGFLQRIFK